MAWPEHWETVMGSRAQRPDLSAAEPAYAHTLRLTFSYEGSKVELISQQSLEMVPPPSDPITEQDEMTGFWYELRDVENHPLYRRAVHNPIKFAVELPSRNREAPFAWEKVSQPSGSFVLLMPDLDQAQNLILFSSPLEPEKAAAPASELASFEL